MGVQAHLPLRGVGAFGKGEGRLEDEVTLSRDPGYAAENVGGFVGVDAVPVLVLLAIGGIEGSFDSQRGFVLDGVQRTASGVAGIVRFAGVGGDSVIDGAVAVVVQAVAGLLGGACPTFAVAPLRASAATLVDAALGAPGALTFFSAFAALLLAAEHAVEALVGGSVAVVVHAVTDLGRAGVDRGVGVVAVGVVLDETGGCFTGLGRLTGVAVAVAVAVLVEGAGHVLVGRPVAIVVASVTDLGLLCRRGTVLPESVHAALHAGAAGVVARSGQVFIDLTVAVVVHVVARLGARSGADAHPTLAGLTFIASDAATAAVVGVERHVDAQAGAIGHSGVACRLVVAADQTKGQDQGEGHCQAQPCETHGNFLLSGRDNPAS